MLCIAMYCCLVLVVIPFVVIVIDDVDFGYISGRQSQGTVLWVGPSGNTHDLRSSLG